MIKFAWHSYLDKYSALLNNAIEFILNIKDDKDVDSLFSSGVTTVLVNKIKGLDDFELITFVVVK